jgi:serine/threonine protein kinase
MGPAEWDRIFDLFHAAREKSGGDRVILLDSACGEGTPIRKAVEELLKQDESADGFLSEPLFGFSAGALRQSPIGSGQRFGRYIIGPMLGRGGMGEVWSARDTDLDRPVALKFLSSEALTILDPYQIACEAKAASALNHPNIVTIHEVVHAESALAIVMELVEGAPLRQLTGKPLPTSELLRIGTQIAEALAAAHGSAIVHGDIKPENIVLRPDGYVKVLDFGLARKVTAEANTVAGNLGLGTLRYMSPEQVRDEALTPAIDIFSFGLVLYELATGRHAFPARSPVDAAQAILTKEPLPFSSVNVPAPVASLIRSMLVKEATARPSAQTVARILKELRAGKEPLDSIPVVLKWAIAATLLIAALFAVWRWKQMRNRVEAPSSVRSQRLCRKIGPQPPRFLPMGSWRPTLTSTGFSSVVPTTASHTLCRARQISP